MTCASCEGVMTCASSEGVMTCASCEGVMICASSEGVMTCASCEGVHIHVQHQLWSLLEDLKLFNNIKHHLILKVLDLLKVFLHLRVIGFQ